MRLRGPGSLAFFGLAEVEAGLLGEAARRLCLDVVAERLGAGSLAAPGLELLGEAVEGLTGLFFALFVRVDLARALERREGGGGEEQAQGGAAQADDHGRMVARGGQASSAGARGR